MSVDRRYLPALALCLAITSAIVWTQTVSARRWDPCTDPAALADLAAVPGTATTQPNRVHLTDGNFLWIDGKLAGGAQDALSARVVRSDRASLLLTNWVSAIEFPMDPGEIASDTLDVDGEAVPIQMARAHLGQVTHVAAFLAVYDGQPTRSVIARQIATAPEQLARGTLPLTLYAVDGFAPPGQEARVEGPAREWLAAAWRRHREVCNP
ncbi:MAG: hypothetical protein VX546_02595 [Myxococcota bacterium]|nr:hypothetical protein [Myxococcota bacterium]